MLITPSPPHPPPPPPHPLISCREELGEENPRPCPDCGDKRAVRTLAVHTLPSTLIIHLKRSKGMLHVVSHYHTLPLHVLVFTPCPPQVRLPRS